MKKLLGVLVAITLCVCMFVPAFAAEEGLLSENIEIARKFQVNKFVNKIEFVITGLK